MTTKNLNLGMSDKKLAFITKLAKKLKVTRTQLIWDAVLLMDDSKSFNVKYTLSKKPSGFLEVSGVKVRQVK